MRSNFLICALLLATASLPAADARAADTPGVAASATVSPAHAAHLRAIIDGIALYEIMRRQQLPAALDGYDRQFAQLFLRQTSEDELARRLVPSFAKTISPPLAAQVAKLVSAPAVRQRELRNTAGSAPQLSKTQLEELIRIEANPAMKEFRRLQPALHASVKRVVSTWSEEFGTQLHARAWGVLEKLDEDLRAARNAQLRQVEIGKVGFEPLDQLVRAVGKCTLRFAKAFEAQGKELQNTRYDEYFQAERLANSQHLVNAYEAIDRAEWILENTLKELNAAIREREEGIAQSAFANQPGFRGKFDDATARMYTFAGDYGEAARRLTAQHRKVVAFMQTHLFNVTVKDGKLLFSDEDDLRQASEIFEQLTQARARLDEVIASMGAAPGLPRS
jgi:hypothetical protein